MTANTIIFDYKIYKEFEKNYFIIFLFKDILLDLPGVLAEKARELLP